MRSNAAAAMFSLTPNTHHPLGGQPTETETVQKPLFPSAEIGPSTILRHPFVRFLQMGPSMSYLRLPSCLVHIPYYTTFYILHTHILDIISHILLYIISHILLYIIDHILLYIISHILLYSISHILLYIIDHILLYIMSHLLLYIIDQIPHVILCAHPL